MIYWLDMIKTELVFLFLWNKFECCGLVSNIVTKKTKMWVCYWWCHFLCDRPARTTGTLWPRAGSWAPSSTATSWLRSLAATWPAASDQSGCWASESWEPCSSRCSHPLLPTWGRVTSSPSGSWKGSERWAGPGPTDRMWTVRTVMLWVLMLLGLSPGSHLSFHLHHVGSMGAPPGEEPTAHHILHW